jgi:hypothetical protein
MARKRLITVQDGAVVGRWIAQNLNGQIGTVGGVVPTIYPAYCRVLHPARSKRWTPLSWREVAVTVGGTMHPKVQWNALMARTLGEESEIQAPLRGRLEPDLFARICSVLGISSSDPAEPWYFAFWIGWAWNTVLRPQGTPTRKAPGPAAPSFSEQELALPMLAVPPDRQYRVLKAPKSASTRFGRPDGPWGEVSTPNLMWPADHSWCFGSEVDFDSTVVGGTEELISNLIDARNVEAWEIGADAWLTDDADRINARG